MVPFRPFTAQGTLDPDGLIRTLKREGTPERVYNMDLFIDSAVQEALNRLFRLVPEHNPASQESCLKLHLETQRFLGYEYVNAAVYAYPETRKRPSTVEAGEDGGERKRSWLSESEGVISTWDDVERYPWPTPASFDTRNLEWLDKHLPDDMFIMAHGGYFLETLCRFFGYQPLCYLFYDQPDLVQAVADRALALELAACDVMMQCPRVKMFWSMDDWGFKTGTMVSVDQLKQYAYPGHRTLAQKVHDAGRLYLLHSCGKRTGIMEDIISDLRADAIHSFEDTIEQVTDAKQTHGRRISLIGGIDVDFLCRSTESEIRKRVRATIDAGQPGGGWCLGTGNSVANYIPLDNYLAMLDEGRR